MVAQEFGLIETGRPVSLRYASPSLSNDGKLVLFPPSGDRRCVIINRPIKLSTVFSLSLSLSVSR
jgi:hypothetical protein